MVFLMILFGHENNRCPLAACPRPGSIAATRRRGGSQRDDADRGGPGLRGEPPDRGQGGGSPGGGGARGGGRRGLSEESRATRRAARQAGAEILGGADMGLRSDHQTGTSYGRRG